MRKVVYRLYFIAYEISKFENLHNGDREMSFVRINDIKEENIE